MNNNSTLLNELYPIVSKTMSLPKTQAQLRLVMGKYFTRNHENLFTLYPTERILFLDENKKAIYLAAGLNPIQIKGSIKKSVYIKSNWYIMNEPLNTASILILRYLHLKKDEKMFKLFLVYYSCYFYASLFSKYLPYGANEDIMKYVMNHLSNKFMIRKEKSVYNAIQAIALKCHETYTEEIERGSDEDLTTYISGLKVRLNDFLKNIKNEYTKAHEKNSILHTESDDLSEDNFHLADNTSLIIQRFTMSAVNKISMGGLDIKLANFAANMCSISKSEVKNVIGNLSDDNINDIQKIIESILHLFLFEGKNNPDQIHTGLFLRECMTIYKKPNTNDKIILEIKQILDKWLTENSSKYRQTNRPATLSNFRKAIFVYFVLYIQINTR